MPKKLKYNEPTPTQQAAQEALEEARKEAHKGAFIVYAEFEGFKPGELFAIPSGWSLDRDYTELILTKAKKRDGITFLTENGSRVTLPVKEA